MIDHAKQEFLLTEKQAQIFRIIENDPFVTFRQIAKELSVSVATVQVHVRALFKKGYLKSEFKTSQFQVVEQDV